MKIKEEAASSRLLLIVLISVIPLVRSQDSIQCDGEELRCVQVPETADCLSNEQLRYRTFDGTCNNLFSPLQGAAGVPSARLQPAFYQDDGRPVGTSQIEAGDFFSPPWPSPRYISWRVVRNVTRNDVNVDLTHMFMQWGQFLDHDMDLQPELSGVECGCELTPECIPIHVPPQDEVFGADSPNSGECLKFVRTEPVCRCEGPREQVNAITAYIDGSGIYGSSEDVANSLRLFSGGLLKQGARAEGLKGNLPFDEDREEDIPFFKAGDVRVNEQTGLTIMHTLWLREHNRIAELFAEINPCWDDERLYQEARKIVGAEIQVITYSSFLPKIFGDKLETYLPPYSGYDTEEDATIPSAFSSAAYRFGHSLIRDQLERLGPGYTPLEIGSLPLVEAFFNPVNFFYSDGTDPILRGLIFDRAEAVDEFLSATITRQLFADTLESLGMDIASLNIQRGRDHGLPPYREWREFCEKRFPGEVARFRTSATGSLLRAVYGPIGFHKGMDLWVSGLAEAPVSEGLVGPTFACILGLTFQRLRDGDRFYFERESGSVFTDQQLDEIKKTTLARVICDNADDITEVPEDVFLQGPERVGCANIPQINLLAWFDPQCST